MDAKEFEIEKQCDKCQGTGEFDNRECMFCGGCGVVLTELGEKLVDVIDRRIKVLERNRLNELTNR